MAKNYIPISIMERQLARAFCTLQNEQETLNFLRDLLTPAELTEFSRRFEIVQLLTQSDLSYMEIAKKMKTSTTTVTRVALWLENGCNGYKTVLKRMRNS